MPSTGFAWYDALGLLGVGAILLAYALLQAGRWTARDPAYSALNALGAALVLVSLAFEFNLAAAVVESFWLAISGYGLWRAWRSA